MIIMDGVKLQSREKRMGLRAGDGQAFEWRRDARNGEGVGHLGSRRADLGNKMVVFKRLKAHHVEEGVNCSLAPVGINCRKTRSRAHVAETCLRARRSKRT